MRAGWASAAVLRRRGPSGAARPGIIHVTRDASCRAVVCHEKSKNHCRRPDLRPRKCEAAMGNERGALDDQGDRLVVRPLPEDPISAVRGALKGPIGSAGLRELPVVTSRPPSVAAVGDPSGRLCAGCLRRGRACRRGSRDAPARRPMWHHDDQPRRGDRCAAADPRSIGGRHARAHRTAPRRMISVSLRPRRMPGAPRRCECATTTGARARCPSRTACFSPPQARTTRSQRRSGHREVARAEKIGRHAVAPATSGERH